MSELKRIFVDEDKLLWIREEPGGQWEMTTASKLIGDIMDADETITALQARIDALTIPADIRETVIDCITYAMNDFAYTGTEDYQRALEWCLAQNNNA
jgi:hypothetical protein